ncbi:hypothetical protein D3C77_646940 [compost metagenome]
MAVSFDGLIATVSRLLGSIDGKLRNKPDRSEAVTPTQLAEGLQQLKQQLVAGAPEALDQLAEFAAAINNDPDFGPTIIRELSSKASIEKLTTLETAISDGFARLAEVFDHAANNINGEI